MQGRGRHNKPKLKLIKEQSSTAGDEILSLQAASMAEIESWELAIGSTIHVSICPDNTST